ncbi:hypothetical protein MF271_07340 [Deinococcus sp. KNUC1210]|uniref:hypothetical protein n=1 Tax=Deinococcus sp. KNUC1210 TaxID=2917691 RepID=UPI001EF08A68|nr:hypothetical protein [Deinococcus sp. KNUC1210]ULH16394.1 hypothetical protein MF271_07340 [Deinococcus sp. KNUC1210]
MRLVLLAPLLALLLGGCRYTFIPIIPDPVAVSLPTRLVTASLRRDGRELIASAALSGKIEAGYLSVVWFDADRELGRDSVYLDATQRSAEFRITAPDKGSYRALLSFGGVLLRQVELRETGDL